MNFTIFGKHQIVEATKEKKEKIKGISVNFEKEYSNLNKNLIQGKYLETDQIFLEEATPFLKFENPVILCFARAIVTKCREKGESPKDDDLFKKRAKKMINNEDQSIQAYMRYVKKKFGENKNEDEYDHMLKKLRFELLIYRNIFLSIEKKLEKDKTK